jgi:hypothetical protein
MVRVHISLLCWHISKGLVCDICTNTNNCLLCVYAGMGGRTSEVGTFALRKDQPFQHEL